MVSNGGPEEDSAIGVWKSLLEWECRAWGSTQWSAPETATGPSCHVCLNAQGDPARQIYQAHTSTFTHFWLRSLGKAVWYRKSPKSVTLLNLICCVPSVVRVMTSEMGISDTGINFKETWQRDRGRHQQKQKYQTYWKLLRGFRAIVGKWWQRCETVN